MAGLLQADDPALGSPHDGAGEVESGRGLRAAWDHKRIREGDPPFEIGDLRLAAGGEIRGHDLEMPLERPVLRRVCRQLRANREELALDPQDDRVPSPVVDQRARGAQRGDRLVDVAVGLGARIGLRHPTAVQQARLPPISRPGDDALAGDGEMS